MFYKITAIRSGKEDGEDGYPKKLNDHEMLFDSRKEAKEFLEKRGYKILVIR